MNAPLTAVDQLLAAIVALSVVGIAEKCTSPALMAAPRAKSLTAPETEPNQLVRDHRDTPPSPQPEVGAPRVPSSPTQEPIVTSSRPVHADEATPIPEATSGDGLPVDAPGSISNSPTPPTSQAEHATPFLGDWPAVCPTFETPMKSAGSFWITETPVKDLQNATESHLEQYNRYANKQAQLFKIIRPDWIFEALDNGHVRLRPIANKGEKETSLAESVMNSRPSKPDSNQAKDALSRSGSLPTSAPPIVTATQNRESPLKATPISEERSPAASSSQAQNCGIRLRSGEPYYTASKWRFEFSEKETRWITREPVLNNSPAQFRPDHAQIEWITEMQSGTSLIDRNWAFSPLPDGRVALVKRTDVSSFLPRANSVPRGRIVDGLPPPSDGFSPVETLVPRAEVQPLEPRPQEEQKQWRKLRRNPNRPHQTVGDRLPVSSVDESDRIQLRPR